MIFMIEIKVPAGISAEVANNIITISSGAVKNSRNFNDSLLKIKVNGDTIKIEHVKEKRIEKVAASAEISLAKEINNDIKGVGAPFEKQMSIVYAHFPMVVEVKGPEVVIKNMLGERDIRTAKIIGNTKVEVKGQNVKISGPKLDDVGQTAANIRTATKVRHKDIRIFQDGIYYAIEE
jgi:large subunit ribosomal protein L6